VPMYVLYEAATVIARVLEKPEEEEEEEEAATASSTPAAAPAQKPAAPASQVFEENDFNLAR